MKERKEIKKNILYILKLLALFCLFVVSGFINKSFGMLIFGAFVFCSIWGNQNYKIEHNEYEEILQSKREILNYDKTTIKKVQNEKNEKPHMAKFHLIIIACVFAIMYFIGTVSVEFGMIVFGGIIFYVIYVSD